MSGEQLAKIVQNRNIAVSAELDAEHEGAKTSGLRALLVAEDAKLAGDRPLF
jgi:hypothetical protein